MVPRSRPACPHVHADAQKFVLGYVWILEPLFLLRFFMWCRGQRQSGRADFLAFLIVGKLPFQWFAGVNHSARIVAVKSIISSADEQVFPTLESAGE